MGTYCGANKNAILDHFACHAAFLVTVLVGTGIPALSSRKEARGTLRSSRLSSNSTMTTPLKIIEKAEHFPSPSFKSRTMKSDSSFKRH